MNEIELKDVKWHPKSGKICQIPKEGLEFAMLSKNYQQLNQLVWCKDFMQDVIWAHYNQTPIEIYGFTYDPLKSPAPSLAKVKLLVTNYKDTEFGNKLINNVLPLLHSVEKRLDMSLTKLEKCRVAPPIYRKSGVWILNGSKRWLKATPMLSLYTLLIRIGLVHSPEDDLETTLSKIKNGTVSSYFDNNNRDKRMIENAAEGITRILTHSDRKLFSSNVKDNYPKKYYTPKKALADVNINFIHNNCGIVGYSQKQTDKIFPQWNKGTKK